MGGFSKISPHFGMNTVTLDLKERQLKGSYFFVVTKRVISLVSVWTSINNTAEVVDERSLLRGISKKTNIESKRRKEWEKQYLKPGIILWCKGSYSSMIYDRIISLYIRPTRSDAHHKRIPMTHKNFFYEARTKNVHKKQSWCNESNWKKIKTDKQVMIT